MGRKAVRRTWGGTGLAVVLAVVAAFAVGCTEDSPCDDNQIYLDDGYCYPVDAGAAPSDASVLGGEAGVPAFGQACTSDPECVAPTTYCAVQPGTAVGFCTAFGCNLDPGICPSGWGCMDLTPFGLPQHICIPGT